LFPENLFLISYGFSGEPEIQAQASLAVRAAPGVSFPFFYGTSSPLDLSVKQRFIRSKEEDLPKERNPKKPAHLAILSFLSMVWQGIRDPDHGEERKEMAGGSLRSVWWSPSRADQ
jgi:hypothetical protein